MADENIRRFRIRRIDGYKVIDREGTQISPDFLSKEECKSWIKEFGHAY